jgi:hypothetical protein
MKDEKVSWADRSMFFYWTRRYPELYNNIAFQKGGYKLVGMTDFDAKIEDFEFFNLRKDPYEQNNIVKNERDKALELKEEFDQTYKELITSENLINPQKIVIGSEHENPITLNRNDAGGERGIWSKEEVFGKWDVRILPGVYNVKFKFIKPIEKGGRMYLETKGIINQKKNNEDNIDILEMKNISLSAMDCDLIPFYMIKGKKIFPFWVELKKLEGNVK